MVTNSYYSYLWSYINDKYNFSEIILCVDNTNGFDFKKNFRIINYNPELFYTDRLISVISKIDAEYILLIHDVDLIINFDINLFNSHFNTVINYDIDRLSLGVFNLNKRIIYDNNISITNINGFNLSQNFLTPFDYAPSLYKCEKLLNFYKNFQGQKYSHLEHDLTAQSYIMQNFNCYGLCKDERINLIYHRGFVYSTSFNFLHITIGGKFMSLENYFDLKEEFLCIKNKYKLDLETVNYKLKKTEI